MRVDLLRVAQEAKTLEPALPAEEALPRDDFPVTGKAAGLLCRRPEDGKYLLLRRAGEQDYQQMWSLPGGGIDEGETAIEAAFREFKEECGVEPNVIHLHGKLVYPGPPVKYTTFLAQLSGTPRIKLNKREHDKYKWVSIKEARELDLHPGLTWAFDHLEGQGEHADKVERYGF